MNIVNEMKTMRSVAREKTIDVMKEILASGLSFPVSEGALIEKVIGSHFLTFQLELLEASQEESAEPEHVNIVPAKVDFIGTSWRLIKDIGGEHMTVSAAYKIIDVEPECCWVLDDEGERHFIRWWLLEECFERVVVDAEFSKAFHSACVATYVSKFPPKPDPMEEAAIDAGYIKDVRDKSNEKGDYPVPIVAGELWRYVGDGSDFFTISKTYLVMDFNHIGDVVLIDDHGSRHPWSKTAFLNDFVRVQLS